MMAYLQNRDVQYIAEDALFKNMSTGEEYRGRAEIGGLLHYMYQVAFDAIAEVKNVVITEDKAMFDGYFKGRHIGAYNGLAATQKEVNVPLCVTYDLADGLIRCAMTPRIEGRQYVLGAGASSTMAGFAASIAGVLGVPAPRPGLPAAPFRAAQRAAALVFRLTGVASAYVHDREVLVADKRATSARARAELGYDPRASVDEAVRAMVDGFLAAGQLPARRTA